MRENIIVLNLKKLIEYIENVISLYKKLNENFRFVILN
jgi:hypothetical protein